MTDLCCNTGLRNIDRVASTIKYILTPLRARTLIYLSAAALELNFTSLSHNLSPGLISRRVAARAARDKEAKTENLLESRAKDQIAFQCFLFFRQGRPRALPQRVVDCDGRQRRADFGFHGVQVLEYAAADASRCMLVRRGQVNLMVELQGLPTNDDFMRTGTHFVRKDNNASVILFYKNLYVDPTANSIAYQVLAMAVVNKVQGGKVFWKLVSEPQPSSESPISYRRLNLWFQAAFTQAVVNTGGMCYSKAYGRCEPPLNVYEIMSVDPDTGRTDFA